VKAKNLVTLAAIAAIVVGLGLYRSHAARARSAAEPEAAAEPGHGLPGLLDFGKGECLPCQQMMPILDELAERHRGRIVVRYVDMNVPRNKERADAMEVRVIPTQILIDAEGKEVIRHEGLWPIEEIELELEVLGWIPER
jgi:thioredoxin 1